MTGYSTTEPTHGEVVVRSTPAILVGPSRFDYWFGADGRMRNYRGEVCFPDE